MGLCKGRTEIVTLLLDRGAAPNARQEGALGDTVLNAAARDTENARVVALLLDRGADVNRRGKDRRTPLIVAAQARCPSVIALLLDRGAEVNAEDDSGETAVDKTAAWVGQLEKMGRPANLEKVLPLLERHGGKPGSHLPKPW